MQFLKNISIILIVFLMSSLSIHAQNPAIIQHNSRIKTLLNEENIDRDAIIQLLREKGFDINNLTPQQAISAQDAIRQIIEELKVEQEKQQEIIIKENSNGSISLHLNLSDSISADPLLASLDSILQVKSRPVADIYGHHIFKTDYTINSDRIKDSSRVSFIRVSDSYVLGVGDELTISIFGVSQLDAKFKINEAGYIHPAGKPKIFLKGVQWGQAKKLIYDRYRPYGVFRSDQIAISLSQPRTITVNVFGEVEGPGSYTFSAANTAFNALVEAGGPTERGSIRNIKIINDTEQKELDIYEFMTNPSTLFDYYLEDNTIIQVPSATKVVKIQGAIQRPLKYELKDKEGLEKLIEYAGSLSADAFKELIQIYRFQEGVPVLEDVNWLSLQNQNKDFLLQNGDSIIIKSLEKEIENVVSIEGAVGLTGMYALPSTPKISDLLKKGRLKEDARLDVAFLIRRKSDKTNQLIQVNLEEILNNPSSATNLSLQAEDRLLVNYKSRYADRFSIKVRGAVRDNIEYSLDADSSITVQQAILLAGGLMPEATDFAYLIRTNPNNENEKEYKRVDIKEALENPNNTANLTLKALDELIVLAKSAYTNVSTVTIKGAVRFPGEFQYDQSLSLKDVLSLAGGFTLEAALNRIEIYRLEINENQPTQTNIATISVDQNFNILEGTPADFTLMPYDDIIVRSVPDFERKAYVQLKGEVLFPGEYALVKKNETLANLIQRAGGLTTEAFPEGVKIYRDSQYYVVTQLDEALINNNSTYDLLLKRQDIIEIPKKKDIVNIYLANTKAFELYPDKFNAVEEKIAVAYQSGKSAKWYVDEYLAGFGKNALKTSLVVQHPNGAIEGTKNWGLFKSYPKPGKGASISIGAKPMDETRKENEKNKGQLYKIKKGTIISIGTGIEEENNSKSLQKKQSGDNNNN